MPGRKKRVKKGIESIRKQIEIHEAKLHQSKKEGNIGLEEYYEKEIENLHLALTKKQAFLQKKKKRTLLAN